MRKMFYVLTAMGFCLALSPIASPKVEAASINPAAIAQSSPGPGVLLAEWDVREHRSHWRFWERRHRDHDYGYRHGGYRREGYTHRRYYGDRDGSREAYGYRRGY